MSEISSEGCGCTADQSGRKVRMCADHLAKLDQLNEAQGQPEGTDYPELNR